MKHGTRIGYWNVRTMWETGKLAQIEEEMIKYKLAVLGISEARWNSFGEIKTLNGNTLLYSGRTEEQGGHKEGVAILLNKETKKSLMAWKPVSERIIYIRLKTKVRPISIVQCYAPTEVAKDEDKNKFYDQLYKVLREIKKKDILIIMGDINAQLGEDNNGSEMVMGRQAMGLLNDNGERFIELCSDFNLVIGGTIFPHKKCHKISWVSPDQTTQNQIDHFAISKKFRSSLLDVRNKRGADVGSDHHLMVATIRLRIARIINQMETGMRKLDIDRLKDQDILTKFCLELRNRFEALTEEPGNEIGKIPDQTINQEWERTQRVFKEAGEKVIGHKQGKKKVWITENSWELVKQRKALKNQMNAAKTRGRKKSIYDQYSLKNKEVKNSLRRDKRKWIEQLAEKAQLAANKNNSRELYRITKILANKPVLNKGPVKDRNGKILNGEMEQINRWKEYFSDISSNGMEELNTQEEETETDNNEHLDININPITKQEIKKALKDTKNGKASGIDNINAEMLKADLDLTAEVFHPIFQKIWEEEKIPLEWGKGVIIKIPKKGDLAECGNWRGITLLSIPSKVFTRIILNRIRNKVEETLNKTQHGFRTQKSCTDLINTLRIIMEQSLEWNSPLYLNFIDFAKAFDSIKRREIWKKLNQIGMPNKIINIIKNMYENQICQVSHRGRLSEPFHTPNGVKQGCLLSPILFILALDTVMKEAKNKRARGIQWGLYDRLESVEYADDVCLLAHRFTDMRGKLQDLNKTAISAGLHINKTKTKEMRINNNIEEKLTLEDEEIQEVGTLTYLGSIISNKGGSDEDVLSRIRKARFAFSQLTPIWKSKQITRKLKIRIFNTNVKTVLLYGCETWKVTKTINKKLQVFVNRCLRNIMGIYWPRTISNKDLWKTAEQEEIWKEVKFRKWKWIGHVLRREDGNIAKTAFEWNPHGVGRRQGRPRTTWCNTVRNEAETAGRCWKEIKEMAQNRVRWRSYIKALCFPEE